MWRNVIWKEDYDAMSAEAAAVIVEVIQRNSKAVIVLATGHSPLGAYRILAEEVKKGRLDVSGATFVKLDEWMGIAPEDEASCEHFIRREIVEPLGIKDEKYLHFSSNAKDVKAECERVEKAYEAFSKVDLVILGIGMNGHLGLNEPDDVLLGGVHVMELSAKTKGHEMLSHTEHPVSRGITLGMENLFKGERILLLADGKEKEKGLSCYLDDRITTQVPVSLLKLHPNCLCIVNGECFKDLEGLPEA